MRILVPPATSPGPCVGDVGPGVACRAYHTSTNAALVVGQTAGDDVVGMGCRVDYNSTGTGVPDGHSITAPSRPSSGDDKREMVECSGRMWKMH